MPKLYSSKWIITILERHGFILIGQRGSHKKFRKNDKTVIVPDPRHEIPMGTFHSILRQAGLQKSDFKK